jgi:hypothetical protein
LSKAIKASFGFTFASTGVLVEVLGFIAFEGLSALASTDGVAIPLEKGIRRSTGAAFGTLALTSVTVVEGESSCALVALRLILLNKEN